jgi:trehalose/maltose transport system substrate-binding protein
MPDVAEPGGRLKVRAHGGRGRLHRRAFPIGMALVLGATLAACGGGGSGIPTLTWYTNPDNGGQAALAAKCTDEADGAYRIEISELPADADSQREQLVRRLAANDSSIDLMSLDPVFVPEFANAGFLRPFSASEAETFTRDVLRGPLATAMWDDKLVAAPFWANTQLLWYRKSVAQKAGLDLVDEPVTWDQVIDAAKKTNTTVEVQADMYEGYMVWINALVESAGGEVVKDPQDGKNAQPELDSTAGRMAAEVIRKVAHDGVADPQISTSEEETARAGFQADNGGFMVNYPYIYGAARTAVQDGSFSQAAFDDIGWARYPRVDAGVRSKPPLGGINLGIGAFGKHQDDAVDAAACITKVQSQIEYMVAEGNSGARSAVFDDPKVRELFPMADLIRDSIDTAGARPESAYYPDISGATVREFHPPSSVNPNTTPAAADKLIVNVLHDKQLL